MRAVAARTESNEARSALTLLTCGAAPGLAGTVGDAGARARDGDEMDVGRVLQELDRGERSEP